MTKTEWLEIILVVILAGTIIYIIPDVVKVVMGAI